MNIYESACEKAQEGLWNCFFDEKTGVMVNHMPVREEENWIYWWHAHALDALLDGYLRKTEGEYLAKNMQVLIGKMAIRFCITGTMTWSG